MGMVLLAGVGRGITALVVRGGAPSLVNVTGSITAYGIVAVTVALAVKGVVIWAT
jgi:hypothetical protein